MPATNRVQANIAAVQARIEAACRAAGRLPASVQLLAVSKTFDAGAVEAAHRAGLTAFGENYVQEAVDKIGRLRELPLQWHFIGPLQSNKTRLVAENFDWVHSIDRLKIAERLSAQRPAGLSPLQVCIEVNVSGEASKGGVALADAAALAHAVAALPHLTLRGLMSIPEPVEGLAAQRVPHRVLRELFDNLKQEGLPLDTLSMGMSGDLEAAIHEGATIVRVGSAIFGARSNTP